MGEQNFILASTLYTLNDRPGSHDRAIALLREGDLGGADEAFQRAIDETHVTSVRLHPNRIEPSLPTDELRSYISREVAYGRVLLHWAMAAELQFGREPDPASRRTLIATALSRAMRGLVLLQQDQHGIVTADETERAEAAVGRLQSYADGSPLLAHTAEQIIHTIDPQPQTGQQLAA